MIIEEATEILDHYWHQPMQSPTLEQLMAIKLGIEALKRIKYYREELERNKILKVHLLPGETED